MQISWWGGEPSKRFPTQFLSTLKWPLCNIPISSVHFYLCLLSSFVMVWLIICSFVLISTARAGQSCCCQWRSNPGKTANSLRCKHLQTSDKRHRGGSVASCTGWCRWSYFSAHSLWGQKVGVSDDVLIGDRAMNNTLGRGRRGRKRVGACACVCVCVWERERERERES